MNLVERLRSERTTYLWVVLDEGDSPVSSSSTVVVRSDRLRSRTTYFLFAADVLCLDEEYLAVVVSPSVTSST